MSDVAMNYFEYQDFAKVDKATINLTTNMTPQTNSDVEQLRYGVMSYEYASFEKDAYVTDNPKELAPFNALLGLVYDKVTDANGDNVGVAQEVGGSVLINLNGAYSFPGVYIEAVNLNKKIEISYADKDNVIIETKEFTPNSKKEFYPFIGEGVYRVVVRLHGTVEPYHFIGLNRLDLGVLRVFDAHNLIDANVTTHFDVDGSTIQYDVAELSIFAGDNDNEYLFQKKQPLIYKDALGNTLHQFYVDSGKTKDDATIDLTAYDSISLLEEEYLGGIYDFVVNSFHTAPKVTYQSLVDDILKGTGVEYEVADSIKDILVTGYIPICTRRKALSLLCKGTNTRVYKHGGKIYLKPLDESSNIEYTEQSIAENPDIRNSQKIGKLTVIEHKYTKSTEPVDLYNWYLQQGENTMQLIKFDRPVYRILAFEVTGVDENGVDIVSTSSSLNVDFYHAPIGGGMEEGDFNICNYCIIKSANTLNPDGTIRKVVIRGWEILDDTNDNIYYERTDLDTNAEYEEIEIDDVTLTTEDGGADEVAKVLFAIENQRQTEEFMVVEVDRPNVGDNVSTPMISSPVSMSAYNKNGKRVELDYNVKITEINDNLSGVYEVVAK